MSNISDLQFDDKNFNQHTAKGMGLLEKSLQQPDGPHKSDETRHYKKLLRKRKVARNETTK